MSENQKLGIPRTHPDFVKARRQRFCKLLREAKRTLNFSPEERAATVALCEMIERSFNAQKVKESCDSER